MTMLQEQQDNCIQTEQKLKTLTAASINAERFIPLNKQLQWNHNPETLLVAAPSRGVDSITPINQWLNDPKNRRSPFDLCTFNLIHFIPEGEKYLIDSALTSFTPLFDDKVLFQFHFQIMHFCRIVERNQYKILGLQHRLNSISTAPQEQPPSLEKILMQRRTLNPHHFDEDRIIRTTPESLARVCDKIQILTENHWNGANLNSSLRAAMELQECLNMVCKDYLTKTMMLMDIERMQAFHDLTDYDMYSCRFDMVEIPPPPVVVDTCGACLKYPIRFPTRGNQKFCRYHKMLQNDTRYRGFDSFPILQNIQGWNKPSIARTQEQFKILEKSLKRGDYRYEQEIIVYLTVPGIRENRPLVSIGDLIRFRFGATEVVGDVREIQVKTERVMLFLPIPLKTAKCQSFFKALLTPKNRDNLPIPLKVKTLKKFERFDVRFGLFGSRGHDVFKATVQENAMNSAKLVRVLAPTPLLDNVVKRSDRRPQTGISKWSHDNLNSEQKHAVFDIVRENHGRAPYCIYGPPGTGKTVTIVESIVQILRYDDSKKILVTAPSDAACDVIAKRLLPILRGTAKMLRLNWVSRNPSSLPPVLLGCSPMDATGFFTIPSQEQIQEASVVICQCFVAGCLEASIGPWMSTHFNHCFIDESSQR
jgi:hypothetical protein